MRIIAKLDVKPPYVVKPVHFEGLRKVGEPRELAKKYYTQGADEVFYMDIVASLYQRDIFYEPIEAAAKELFIPFAVGGGVRDLEGMSRLFHSGADKVVINTYALQHDPSLIDRAAKQFGAQSIVVSIEAKRSGDDWECYSDCGRERSGKLVMDWAREVQERGAGELLVQSVDHDGRQIGFDIDLVRNVKQLVSIPVVAASGAGSLEHIVKLAREAQPDALALASILHYDHCDISAVKAELSAKSLSE